jgi:hypothetical protein
MAKGRLFGDRPVGAVTVVEAPVSQWYARRARIAFMGVAGVTGVVAAGVLSVFTNPLVAILLGIIAGIVCGFVAAAWIWAWPVLRVLWWWATELVVATVALVVLVTVARVTFPLVAAGLVVVLAAVVGLVGSVRRRVSAWSWCVIVRHRLRLCFAEFIRATSRVQAGRLPLILWARPTRAGERVWVWLRPGLELLDLEGKTGKLAVACWAGEARVVRASARYSALLRIDITHRDPLTGRVLTPLGVLFAQPPQTGVSESAGMPTVGLDLDDVPEPAEVPARGSRR